MQSLTYYNDGCKHGNVNNCCVYFILGSIAVLFLSLMALKAPVQVKQLTAPISSLLSAQQSKSTQEYQPTLGTVSISRLENSLNHWALAMTWATSS